MVTFALFVKLLEVLLSEIGVVLKMSLLLLLLFVMSMLCLLLWLWLLLSEIG